MIDVLLHSQECTFPQHYFIWEGVAVLFYWLAKRRIDTI